MALAKKARVETVSYLEGLPKPFVARADLELHVQDRVLQAHSALLSLHSSTFATIISDLETTSGPTRPQPIVVPMTGDCSQHVLALLSFIYKMSQRIGGMPNILQEAAVQQEITDMAVPAHKYGFDKILCYCDDSLSAWAAARELPLHNFIMDWICFSEQHKLAKTLAAWELQLISSGTNNGFKFSSRLSPQSLARLIKGFEHEAKLVSSSNFWQVRFDGCPRQGNALHN